MGADAIVADTMAATGAHRRASSGRVFGGGRVARVGTLNGLVSHRWEECGVRCAQRLFFPARRRLVRRVQRPPVMPDGGSPLVVSTARGHALGPVAVHLVADHERLDALLRRAIARPDVIDLAAYDQFRRGLLRHIGMEEKILLPAVQRLRGGTPLPAAARLRNDHGALAALLVPRPSPAIVAALRHVLAAHNALEEGPRGVYAACEALVGAAGEALAAELRAAPEVPVHALVEDARVLDATRRALARAGYDPASV